jgi:DNA primase
MSELAARAATDPAARQRYLELAASLKTAADTAR